MRRLSRQTARPLALFARLAGVVGSLVATALAVGCGEDVDVCVVINSTSGPMLEWSVTLAVSDAESVAALDVDVHTDPCHGVCDCHVDCGCGDRCDCHAHFSNVRTELDCEPLVNASYRGTLDEGGTAHVELAAEEAIVAPVDILKCDYSSATEPSPSDFRIVVNRASGASAKRLAPLPTIVVADISAR